VTVEVRRAAARFVTRADGIETWHCFSYGAHYDPANTRHGLLVACNDSVVRPGAGFATHPHRGLEIVTWIVAGELRHADDLGNAGVVGPGVVQRLSAGSGVRHSERNARTDADLRFVQTWLLPDGAGGEPSYERIDVRDLLANGGLHRVVRLRDAVLWAGLLPPGERVTLPDDEHVHVYVVTGSATVDGAGEVTAGDSVRLTAAGATRLAAGAGGGQVLVWATA
jgi:redox-sensitive bicupin YhaK (pirin superfamily)